MYLKERSNDFLFRGGIVFNATLNNISAISRRSALFKF